MTVHELDLLGEPRNGPVQQELQKITGVITVPQVFINGKFAGPAEAFDEKVAAKTLDTYLKEQGVDFE